MSETEGVVKFQLQWEPGPPWRGPEIDVLERWRTQMLRNAVLGQDPQRYGGFGFGNLSARVESGFLISGTQTGANPALGPEGYAVVVGWDLGRNRVMSRGPVKPSSESLTHAALYDTDAEIHWVFHGHSPALWRQAAALGLPITDPLVAYGTPAMAAEVQRLCHRALEEAGILVMGGHQDGFLAFGAQAEATGAQMLEHLERARRNEA